MEAQTLVARNIVICNFVILKSVCLFFSFMGTFKTNSRNFLIQLTHSLGLEGLGGVGTHTLKLFFNKRILQALFDLGPCRSRSC